MIGVDADGLGSQVGAGRVSCIGPVSDATGRVFVRVVHC